MESKAERQNIYDLFRIGVLAKAVQSAVEIGISVVLFVVPLSAIVRIADRFTEGELANDPNDFIANHLADFAHSLSIGAKEYAAIYLFLHAATKLVLAIALLRDKRWAYPAALIVLGLLIAYQWYRVFLHHSTILAGATVLDCFVFYFVYREWRIVEEKRARQD